MGFCTGFAGLKAASLVSGHSEKAQCKFIRQIKLHENGDPEINETGQINQNGEQVHELI